MAKQKNNRNDSQPESAAGVSGLVSSALFAGGSVRPRIAAAFGLFAVLLALLSIQPGISVLLLKPEEGQRSNRNVVARTWFEYTYSWETEEAKEIARASAPRVYRLTDDLVEESTEIIDELFNKVRTVGPILLAGSSPGGGLSSHLNSNVPLQGDASWKISDETLRHLMEQKETDDTEESPDEETIVEVDARALADESYVRLDRMKKLTLEVVGTLLSRSIFRDDFEPGERILLIQRTTEEAPAAEKIERVSEVDLAKLVEYLSLDEKTKNVLLEIVVHFRRATVKFDEKKTREGEDAAAEAIEPNYQRFPQGAWIVNTGQTFDPQILAKLQAYQAKLKEGTAWPIHVANTILVMALVTLYMWYLGKHRPEDVRNIRHYIFLLVVIAVMVGASKTIFLFDQSTPSSYFVPVAAGAIIIAVMFDSQLAVLYSVIVASLISVIYGWDLKALLVVITGSITGVLASTRIRRRTDLMRPALAVIPANVAIIIAISLFDNEDVWPMIQHVGFGITNGCIVLLLVQGFLNLSEALFGITTDFTLMELSDVTQHPLLRRMQIEAQGTYHHSLLVSTLAENAAEEIGANSLLARVGAYFHDIGKLDRPDYFAEDQEDGQNVHDELSPSMSNLVLINHVKKGVELAKEFKLPKSVIEIIQQHQGKCLTFFYYKAHEENGGEVSKEDFRYPGPKPQSKEAGIIMLADGCEAAVRSLVNPAHGKIKNMIEKVIGDRVDDGQLDECELTLKDLHVLKETFARMLTAVRHKRVEYPTEKEDGTKEKPVKNGSADKESVKELADI
ncbi:HD family phosphohydrolase [Candidatus Hydrogenedentota bacterium]